MVCEVVSFKGSLNVSSPLLVGWNVSDCRLKEYSLFSMRVKE